MAHYNPTAELTTHDVTNQPPPFEDINLYQSDKALSDAVHREGAAWAEGQVDALGKRAGSAEVLEWSRLANANGPQLRAFDRYGHRIDEVEFHPAYHALMDLGIGHEVPSIGWTAEQNGHAAHAALKYLTAQADPGVCCPMTMTYAAVPVLRQNPDLDAVWVPKIKAAVYDPTSQPMEHKRGVTLGMAMTEKQGGSDVRANTTTATPIGTQGASTVYELTGHKWFCSAPMCDGFLTLAQAPGGLSCFLVPRWKPDGTRNTMHIMRLKDKLGDRSNASSEIEYHRTYAVRIGEEGRGIAKIMAMVQHTRLDTITAPAAYMRQALANALWHTAHRTAFQRRLVDQPLMRRVLADLALETEAAVVLFMRIARSFDEAPVSPQAEAFQRLATPVGKYWINKRVVPVVAEAMECHGGAGYIEETVLPRIYRQSPLNGIWEGSGNVICLDVLRAMGRDPQSVEAFLVEIIVARGGNTHLDRAADDLATRLRPEAIREADARRLAEDMALTLQGALLVQHAPSSVSDAFCAARLGQEGGLMFGTLSDGADIDGIIERAMPLI